MIWNNSSFTEHYKKIRIEGFQPDRLIDKCVKNRIQLRAVTFISDLELTLMVSSRDFQKLKQLAKNTYKITVLREGGYRYALSRLKKRKVTLIGLLLLVAFFYYQSLFIVEIRIDGYAKIGEEKLRRTLAETGLYEGCRKNIDANKVKIKLYEKYDEISWVGIVFKGNLAEVTIAEGAKPVKTKVEKKKPCNIVADKAGYISRIIPVEGLRAVEDDTYVKKGDALITGIVPLRNVAYGTDSEDQTEICVHAEGTAEARVPVRLNFYAERYKRIKNGTGNKVWGLAVNDYNFAKAVNPYEVCMAKTRNLVNLVKPIRLKIDLVSLEEVKLAQKEIKKEDLKRAVNAAIRQYAKENLPKKAQILNKSLNFSPEKNIINIGVTLETLQQIGIEEEIIVDKSDGKAKKDYHQPGDRPE